MFSKPFAKSSVPLGTGTLSFQGGRQEISFGTERLLGTRYGPNVPLSFDGGLVRWQDPFWDFHGFYLRPVQVTPDLLDNLSGADQQLWGLYLTRRLDGMLPFVSTAAVDLYYIGFFDAPRLTIAEPVASCGTPLARDSSEVGRSALECSTGTTKACCSSAVSTASVVMVASSPGAWERELGYTIDTFATPRLSLRANIISGNRSVDSANLQTFNPLFPKGKYFGELTPVGPYNLINRLGAVGLSLSDQIAVYVQGGPSWRYSAHDAVYGVGGNIVRSSDSGPGNTSNARFVGTQLEFVAEWISRPRMGFSRQLLSLCSRIIYS